MPCWLIGRAFCGGAAEEVPENKDEEEDAELGGGGGSGSDARIRDRWSLVVSDCVDVDMWTGVMSDGLRR